MVEDLINLKSYLMPEFKGVENFPSNKDDLIELPN